MKTWIALLRGINVGGRNKVTMKDLREHLTAAGLANARTYIQSGNIAFETDNGGAKTLSALVSKTIDTHFGFAPNVLMLSKDDMQLALDTNPFPQAADDPKSLHLCFLEAPAKNPDLAALNALKTDTEDFRLSEACFYLYAPDGIGRSKLAAQYEKKLGVPVTARNLRSVLKILELADTHA